MSSMFTPGQGMFVRTPSWHRLEKVVLQDWPGTWEAAWAAHGSPWEPVVSPVYAAHRVPDPNWVGRDPEFDTPAYVDRYEPIKDWQRITRSDNGAVLSLQEKSYRVIGNAEFGSLIDTVMGLDLDAEVKFEAVFELYGGRMVVAVVYLDEPVQVPGDPSQTVRYLVFSTRHDGQGGWRILLTNVRVVCANTLGLAESGAHDGQSQFTIRHTANWDEKTAEVRDLLVQALEGAKAYDELAGALVAKRVTTPMRERYLERLLRTDSGMSMRQLTNRENERQQIRTILEGPTCEGIEKTAWGLLNATTEWSDHYRTSRTSSGLVNRQLFVREPTKTVALRLVKEMAGIR